MTCVIPSPPGLPLIGHSLSFDYDVPIRTLQKWGEIYGEIFQLYFISGQALVINTVELLAECSNDKKFTKSINGPVALVRDLGRDGLFTGKKSEPNYGIAHRILSPRFKSTSVRDMFPEMVDLVSQLILKWERFGPRHAIHAADDFTRLSFDTIALCSMSYRINSFYREDNHPFVQAMGDFLTECSKRVHRTSVGNVFMRSTTAKFYQDMDFMYEFSKQIVEERKSNPVERHDLLYAMLHDKDPKTGEMLPEDCIIRNLCTFLVAGHETTAGFLTYALYFLIKHPEVMKKAQAEIDDLIGDQPVQVDDLHKFPYLTAIMRETLRLGPTIPWRQIKALEDTTIGGGKYFVPKGRVVVVHLEKVQRDRSVYGEDADEFRPERLMDGKFEALPFAAWQPWGFGGRACIGRAFAWQESTLALVMMLQKFDFELADPDYKLDIKQTLTTKPKDFFCHAIPRRKSATGV
ncbi:cytochrome P450 [Trametopsis cervina]|nr:cytochrome P450 [Trametopsis cervina]